MRQRSAKVIVVLPIIAVGCSLASASSAGAAVTSTPSPISSALPSTSASPHHGLTQIQKSALAAALATYKSAIQSALDGAHKAIADAQSIRDQAFAAAPKDKNVHALADSDFKNSSTQIWNAFKVSTAAAKQAYESAINAIKATH